MPDETSDQTPPEKTELPDPGRRNFLLLLPLGIFAGVTATIVTAAYRYLRPIYTQSEGKWSNVAPVSQLKGDKPIMRSIIAEHEAAWAATSEEHFVYVLPGERHQALSSVCPHEGCNVSWRDDTNGFFCPCHDSYFASDGSRVSGPSRRGLDPLPTREQDGILQVQYQTFINNTEERIVRG